jgi:cobalt/nickel transport protein
MRKSILFAIFLLALPASAQAHYNMLFPESPSVKVGTEVKLIYQWGHPFEHELFDAPQPDSLVVLGPKGEKTDLVKKLKKVSVKADKKEVTAYEIAFKPEEPGDYVFVLQTPAIWMDAEKEFYQDNVKVVLHVQAQKGWDQVGGQVLEFVPLTRPYGLLPGTVFQGLLQRRAYGAFFPDPWEVVPVPGSPVEIEHYNATPPKELPADEFITRVVKTDANSVVTCNLPEAGWWCLTGTYAAGKKKHDGKDAPVRQRTTFWVHVAEKPR